MPKLPTNRAFLVQLSAESDASLELLRGRVEHVSSGRSARFESRDEPWEFVAGVLAEAAAGERVVPAQRKPR